MWYYILDRGTSLPETLERPFAVYDVQTTLQEAVDRVVMQIRGVSWCDADDDPVTVVIVTGEPGVTRVQTMFGVTWELVTERNSSHTLFYS